jgi:Fe-S-cluster containining protein
VKDNEHSGRPTTIRTDDNIAAVNKMVKEYRNVMSQLIADTLCIHKTVVLRILREDLKKQKLCSRFVPHALTREKMDERVAVCQDLLNMINSDKNFLDKVITSDESWCFAYDPETKCQSSERVGEHSPRPKKPRFQKSQVKTVLTVFFDSQGNVHKEFVQEGCTVNPEYYKGVLDRLISHIQRVRPALYRTHFFLLHDDAPAHSAAKIRQFLTQKQVATLNPHHSPDLSPPNTSCSRR